MSVQQDKDPASNPDWLRKVEQAERSGDFFPKDSVIINGGKIEDRLVQEIEVIRLVYTNEDFQGIRKEPVTPTSTPKPEHPTETIRTQPGSRRIHRPDQTEIVIDQLIKQGNKAPDKSGTILRAIAAAGNIVPHIPVGVGMVGRETVEAGERFYNRSWSQRGDAALMWWEQIALTVPNLNPYSIAKNSTDAAIRGYSAYLYDPEPFHSFALDGSQRGLSAQLGIGIGKNLTYAAASSVATAPFAGGGVTSIFNGETIPWRRTSIPLDDPLIDNNILNWIARKEPSAIAFANQYKNKLSVNRTVVKEFLHKNTGFTVPQLRQIMKEYGIQLVPSATRAEATALLPAMGKTTLNNDRILIATAHKHGIRFATSDYRALNEARRIGVDVKAWRLIDDGSAAPLYASIKRKLTSQGVKNPELFIGPENPW